MTRVPFWPWAVLWAALFALAHGQSPAFYSNQHQYLLHGLAEAGFGHLNEDWLANTRDPTPVFSWLIAGTYQVTGTFGLHAIYFVLLGAYFESVRRMIEALPGMPGAGAGRSLFLLLFLAVHACVLRLASAELTGVDWPWYLQAGLAAQYLLGPGLQPSVFGVLLVLSLSAFANHRPITAAGLAAGAAVMHSTYLLPAGLLVLGYLVSLTWHGMPRVALAAGLLALAIVTPVLAYNLRSFVGDEPGLLPEAQRILAQVRIPHHTTVGYWLDPVAYVQIGIMVAGLFAVRRTRLFLPLVVPTVLAAILTVIQVLTKSDALALLFPWRFSVVLMPVAVAVLLAKLAAIVGRRADRPAVTRTCLGIAVLLALGGLCVTLSSHGTQVNEAKNIGQHVGGRAFRLPRGYRGNEAEEPLLDYVREHARSGQVYLLPVKFAKLKPETPASQSKTFVPPVRTGQIGIPVDLQRFRLATGEAIYVDFKAVPYAPAEVIEWYRRVESCERWYAERDWDTSGVIDEVIAVGITHVIAAADKDVTSRRLQLVYTDESYRVYRILPR
jgi:hypothetical protein